MDKEQAMEKRKSASFFSELATVLVTFVLAGSVLMISCTMENKSAAAGLSEEDRQAIRTIEQQYVAGWLENDTLKVLATLTDDIVLQPGGMQPINGKEAARSFWWPDDGSKTVITSYETDIYEIEGKDSLAYSRGLGELAFTYEVNGEASEYESRSTSLTIYRKGANGGWKIARRMWASLNQ